MSIIFAILLMVCGLWMAVLGIVYTIDEFSRYSSETLRNSSLVGLYPSVALLGLILAFVGFGLLAGVKRDEERQREIEEERRNPTSEPDDYQSLFDWGLAFKKMARSNRNANLYREAAAKFEAALDKRPDDYLALYELSGAWIDLWRLTGERVLLEKASRVVDRQLRSNPNDAYLGASLATLLGDEAKYQQYLLSASELSVLPAPKVLQGDQGEVEEEMLFEGKRLPPFTKAIGLALAVAVIWVLMWLFSPYPSV